MVDVIQSSQQGILYQLLHILGVLHITQQEIIDPFGDLAGKPVDFAGLKGF